MTEPAERINAAARVRFFFANAIARNVDRSALDLWSDVFEIAEVENTARQRAVVRRLSLLADQIDLVTNFAETAGLRQRMWQTQMQTAQDALFLGNLSNGWSGMKNALVAHGTLHALDWLAERMPEEEAVDVQSKEANELRQELIDLQARVARSMLSLHLRDVLSRAIAEMLRALADAPIAGAAAVRAHAMELHATVVLNADEIESADFTEEVTIFRRVMNRFYAWMPAVEKFEKITSTTVKLIEAVDGVRRLIAGESTQV